jgi:hypothetical protein
LPIFTTTSYPLSALVEDIDRGKIGLPELQRPFVWPNVNVRNLLDSLYRGYPAGYLLFWETGIDTNTRHIAGRDHQHVPSLAIVDGQQRLTCLYAVTKGKEVVRANFKKERIRIAFNPSLTSKAEACGLPFSSSPNTTTAAASCVAALAAVLISSLQKRRRPPEAALSVERSRMCAAVAAAPCGASC